MTFSTEGDDAIHTIADLIAHDFDGSEYVSRGDARRTLEHWCQNSDAARKLIDDLGIDTAVTHYTTAWGEAFEAEYGEEEVEVDPNTCSACGGPIQELGGLGQLTWYRCRNCGFDTSRTE